MFFFSEEELAKSCCRKATGRELLNQTVLLGIKCMFAILLCVVFTHLMYMYVLFILTDQTFYKYQVPKEQIEEKWNKLVHEKLNMRCRTCRRKLNSDKENINN